MANIAKDSSSQAVPGQYYNAATGVFEKIEGSNGASNVQLSGRDVEEVVVWNALAITGTSAQISTAIDLSKYRELFIYAYDSHNQNITLSPQVEGGNVFVWDGTTWSSSEDDVVLVADAFRYVLTSRWNWIKGAKSIRFVAVAAAAPTSGSLTLKIWGVPN